MGHSGGHQQQQLLQWPLTNGKAVARVNCAGMESGALYFTARA